MVPASTAAQGIVQNALYPPRKAEGV